MTSSWGQSGSCGMGTVGLVESVAATRLLLRSQEAVLFPSRCLSHCPGATLLVRPLRPAKSFAANRIWARSHAVLKGSGRLVREATEPRGKDCSGARGRGTNAN